jgi:hypothetical protein
MPKIGASESHIEAIRDGRRKPSVTLRKALIEIAADYARKALPEPVEDHPEACSASRSRAAR